MNNRTALSLVAVSLFAMLGHGAFAAETTLTDDGLEPITVKNIDKAYKRPGASLAGYTKILIRPVTVAFSKNWNPRDYGGTFGMKPEEVEKIRTSLSKLASDTFAKELTRGGYTVTTGGGANVLDVEAQIVDLYVNAPDMQRADVTRSYVLRAGEMRILVTLRDAVTGTTLYRVSDFKRGDETGRLEWANSVFNRVEAERALIGWAQQLKKALDAAKAGG